MTFRPRVAMALAALVSVTIPAAAENWPQWRGPFLDGTTSETNLPAKWSETENVRWVIPMPGPAAATPIVWKDRVFVSSTVKDTLGLVGMCIDAGTGRVLWQKPTGEARRVHRNNMAGPSPVTDGKTVWFHYGTGALVAFDFRGRRLWARELEKDHGLFTIQYGHSASPLLYRGKLYVPVMQNKNPNRWRHSRSDRKGPLDSFLLAIDAKTGRDLWKHVRPTDATDESTESYATPVPYEGAGRQEIIIVAGEHVTGHDAATGRELWRWEFSPHNRKVWQRTVTSPVVGDGLIYAFRPKYRPMYALKGGGSGLLDDGWVVWRYEEYTPDVTTPIIHEGRLYAMHDDKKVMVCFDPATGDVKWHAKLGVKGVIRASPTAADGKIYIISQKGEALVLAAGDEFKVLHRTDMGGAPSRATIAISGGRLFIRTAEKLYCIGK